MAIRYPSILQLLVFCFSTISTAQSLSPLDSLLDLYQKVTSDTTKVWMLMEAGKLYLDSDPDSALLYLDSALALAESIPFEKGIARCNINRAVTLFDQSEFDQVLAICEKTIPICEKLGLGKELVSIYNMLANVWNYKGNHWLAIEHYQNALEVMKTTEVPPHFPIVINNNITILYIDLKLYQKALESSRTTLAQSIAISDEYSMAVSYDHMATAFDQLQEKDSALFYQQKAVELGRKLDYKSLLANALGNLAANMHDRGEIEKARQLYEEGIAISREVGNGYGLMINLHGISLIMLDEKRFAGAKSYALAALEEAMQMDLSDYTYAIYLTLSDIALAQGELESYWDFREKYTLTRDSLANKTLIHAVEELETKYETAKKEQQISELEQQRKVQQLRLRLQSFWLGGLLLFIILTGVVATLVMINLSSRKRLTDQELRLNQQKVKELEQEKQLATAKAILVGQEEERGRLARDLHDGLGGMLSGIKQTLFAMKGNQFLPEPAAVSLNQVVASLDHSITELRHIARNMMPEALVRFGLKHAMEDYCDHLNQLPALDIHFQAFGLDDRLSQETEVLVFRIVQELLNNVVKHADASQALVQIVKDGDRLHLTVEDDGKGMDTSRLKNTPGVGWMNIQSRINYLNGQLDLVSHPGKGTAINIEFNLS